jgi:hypothetical protein
VRAKSFDDARGSAVECAACLDALVAKGVCEPLRIAAGKELVVRSVAMLTKLIARFSGQAKAREEDGGHDLGRADFEDEDDDEDDEEQGHEQE